MPRTKGAKNLKIICPGCKSLVKGFKRKMYERILFYICSCGEWINVYEARKERDEREGIDREKLNRDPKEWNDFIRKRNLTKKIWNIKEKN